MHIKNSSSYPFIISFMASFFIIFFFSIFSLPIQSHSTSLDSFIYGGCSQIKYTPNSPYESNLNSLLTSLVNSATYASYNKYSIMGSSPQDVVYGLYQCRGDLAMPDCATCVIRAVSQFASLCPQTCGGAIQLEGCFVKYDNTSFLGVEEKTVVMKKCGPSNGFDIDVMNRRDAVLGSMSGAGGMYRSGGGQGVEGVAQCVGDLSQGQCQDCVSEAIRRLKTECGGGVYGDMFLGKCYGRYTTNGGAHAYNAKPANHESHSESEKTFAIILGLLAGIALVIILATFMRRICGGNNNGK